MAPPTSKHRWKASKPKTSSGEGLGEIWHRGAPGMEGPRGAAMGVVGRPRGGGGGANWVPDYKALAGRALRFGARARKRQACPPALPAHPGHTPPDTRQPHTTAHSSAPPGFPATCVDGASGGSVGGPWGVAGVPVGVRGRPVRRAGDNSEGLINTPRFGVGGVVPHSSLAIGL